MNPENETQKKTLCDEHPELYEAAKLFHQHKKRTGATDEETMELFLRMLAYYQDLQRQARQLIDKHQQMEERGGQ